jgi:alanine-glyoxylate transaminase / serine-glyoxylate transaminase / serine-pyruvate transaminase
LVATVAGCEMGLKLMDVPVHSSGVQAAMAYFAAHPGGLAA